MTRPTPRATPCRFPGSCFLTTQHDLGNPAGGSPCFTPREVYDFIDYALDAYDVDPARVYLTGLSCGGYGTWEYLGEYGAAQVTAAVPIAGEGRPAWQTAGCDLADVPLWAFHGARDDIVDPAPKAAQCRSPGCGRSAAPRAPTPA